jgi:hypothetical protein
LKHPWLTGKAVLPPQLKRGLCSGLVTEILQTRSDTVSPLSASFRSVPQKPRIVDLAQFMEDDDEEYGSVLQDFDGSDLKTKPVPKF